MTAFVNVNSPITYCVPGNSQVCYSFSVPEKSASSGQGDVYVQIKAPSTMSWVGVAQSPSGMMKGANMLVAYASQNDSAVTLSPRLGTGNIMPHFNMDANLTLLEGSGITNGVMTANVRCSSCNSWQGGRMSLKDPSSTWLYAYALGDSAPNGPIRSDNTSATMSMHQGYGSFQLDLTKAVSSSANTTDPFVSLMMSSNSSISSSSSGATPAAASKQAYLSMLKTTHGSIMGVAFGFLFPFGAILMRLHGKSNTWAVHGGIQALAYCLSIAGMGIGIYLALSYDLLTSPHALIGLVIIFLLFFMPFAGWLQHARFCKFHRRTWWGRGHAYMGRALLILALINVGMGLQLAVRYGEEPVKKGETAYGVLGGIVGLAWLSVIAVTAVIIRRKTTAQMDDEGNAGPIMDSDNSNHETDLDSPIDGEKNLGPVASQRLI